MLITMVVVYLVIYWFMMSFCRESLSVQYSNNNLNASRGRRYSSRRVANIYGDATQRWETKHRARRMNTL